MKTLGRWLSQFLIIFYKIRYGKRVTFGKGVILNHHFKIHGPGRVVIGDDCNLWAHEEANRFFTYRKEAVIKIGAGSRLNGLTCHSMSQITTGENCLIGSAILMDTDFHSFDDPEHILHGKTMTKPITIKDKVWLAGQSAVLKGCTVGSGAVVGFRSVVSKNIPPHSVAVGNPAKVVKTK